MCIGYLNKFLLNKKIKNHIQVDGVFQHAKWVFVESGTPPGPRPDFLGPSAIEHGSAPSDGPILLGHGLSGLSLLHVHVLTSDKEER